MFKRVVIVYFFIVSFLNASQDIIKQKNILLVKNLIKKEELIAISYEKYLLNNFKIPESMNDLLTNSYLGTNFDISNTLGENISFKSINDLKLNISLYDDSRSFLMQLYKRELYRNGTYVNYITNYDDSFVQIEFQTSEAKNIKKILDTGKVIKTKAECPVNPIDIYCEVDEYNIRWYKDIDNWVEFGKKLYSEGSVVLSNDTLETEAILDSLPNGTRVFIKNKGIKIKIDDKNFKEIIL